MFDLGVVYDANGDRNSAIETMRKAVRLNPDYGRAWQWLALNVSGEARVEASRQLLRLAPKCASNWSSLGIAYEQVGKYANAYDAFKTAFNLKDGFSGKVITLVFLTSISAKLGRSKESRMWQQTALEFDRTIPESMKRQITIQPECELPKEEKPHVAPPTLF